MANTRPVSDIFLFLQGKKPRMVVDFRVQNTVHSGATAVAPEMWLMLNAVRCIAPTTIAAADVAS